MKHLETGYYNCGREREGQMERVDYTVHTGSWPFSSGTVYKWSLHDPWNYLSSYLWTPATSIYGTLNFPGRGWGKFQHILIFHPFSDFSLTLVGLGPVRLSQVAVLWPSSTKLVIVYTNTTTERTINRRLECLLRNIKSDSLIMRQWNFRKWNLTH